MSEKKAKLLRKILRGDNYAHYKARAVRRHRVTACPKIDMKKLKRRRRSLMKQIIRAAERRGRVA